jgi:hypothetical protein
MACSVEVRIANVGPAAYAVAFGGRIVSSLSPCVVPLALRTQQ